MSTGFAHYIATELCPLNIDHKYCKGQPGHINGLIVSKLHIITILVHISHNFTFALRGWYTYWGILLKEIPQYIFHTVY